MRALRDFAVCSIKTTTAIFLVACISLLVAAPAAAQTLTGDYTASVDQARRLEREIADLENRLAVAQRDWLAISSRLEEIEQKILNCYAQIDAAEARVENARRNLNSSLRSMYVEGQQDALIEMFSATDVSEFMTRYDYMLHIASHEADDLRELTARRDALRRTQEQLTAYKQEQARLARGSDVAAIQSLIDQKRNELAGIDGVIIASQVPSTNTPPPVDFSPNRVYSQPDENAFVRTGQSISGYSSWYGNEFHGRPTASGEVFDQYGFTCAHRTLPFGTWLRVTFRGRSVIVKVNDRGPFVQGRMLDLSRGAAEAIGLTGVRWIDCEIVVPRS